MQARPGHVYVCVYLDTPVCVSRRAQSSSTLALPRTHTKQPLPSPPPPTSTPAALLARAPHLQGEAGSPSMPACAGLPCALPRCGMRTRNTIHDGPADSADWMLSSTAAARASAALLALWPCSLAGRRMERRTSHTAGRHSWPMVLGGVGARSTSLLPTQPSSPSPSAETSRPCWRRRRPS